MAGRVSLDEQLLRLNQVRDEGDPVVARAAAIKALADKSNLMIAAGAKIIREFELTGVESELVATWKRLVQHAEPIKVDKCCAAKESIIETLSRLDYDEPELYLTGMQYQQVEPAWLESIDTAMNMRALCAFALARSQQIRLVDKLVAFVDLMEYGKGDRVAALRAMSDTGSEYAIPLLRLKLLAHEESVEARGICMAGLLALAPVASIPLVSRYLNSHDEDMVVEAASALGTCGRLAAIESLTKRLERAESEDLRRSLLLSIGLSRDPTAIQFLISRLESPSDTQAALEGLRPACVYQETQSRVQETLQKLGDPLLIKEFERRFGRGDR